MMKIKIDGKGESIMVSFETVSPTHPDGMPLRLRVLALMAFVVWTLAVGASFVSSSKTEARHREATSLGYGLSLIEKDLLYHKWVALQGGIYVPVSQKVTPNPYLNVPERDIETPSGKKLTLVNPCFMARLLHDLAVHEGETPSHFTSLRTTHPASAPDPWEKKALEHLQANPEAAYYKDVTESPQGETLQLMVPVRVEEACLRCHTDPEEILGSVRGGIRVQVSLEGPRTLHRSTSFDALRDHLLVWLLGSAAIGFASFLMYQRIRERETLLKTISRAEKFWKSVLENLQDPLIVLDRDLRVRLINPAAARLAEVKPEEAVGRPCREVFCHWHLHSSLCERCDVQGILENHVGRCVQVEIQLADTSSRFFYVQAGPLQENGNDVGGVIQSFREITQEVMARMELAEQHRELSLLFDHMFGGFALLEILTDDRGVPVDYRFLKVNRAFESLVGLKTEQVLGKTFREVLPEASPLWVERYARTAQSGEPQEFEAFEASLGRHFSVRSYQPEPGKFAVLFFDVTDRKQAEEAVKRSETFFRNLFEKSPQAQLLVDPKDGRILDANEAAERLHGWSREAMKEKYYREVSLDSPEFLEKKFDQALRGDAEPFLAQHRTASGETKSVEIQLGPVTLDGNLTVHVRDVTEREKLQEQLRQAQKMQTVGQLAGGVAHEFNNLLQVINGFVEMVLAETPEGSPNHERLKKVMESGLKGARLVQQILAFSRKQVLRLQPADLNELIERFAVLARKLVGENIVVEHIAAENPVRVNIDRQAMEQVLWNLVVNARDAMPDGGRITIETKHMVLDEHSVKKQPDASPGRYVVVAVTDTGCGMTKEVRQRAFEPFFTTKEVGKGTGLGLSVAYGIVKQHGGMINVYSEIGKGTTFRIYLRPYEEGEEPLEAEVPEEELVQGAEVILLAEDEPPVRQYLAEALREAGYQVLEAGSGLEAVEIFATTLARVDLVIFDLVMPGMGGEEALALIRRTGWNIPAVFLSGYTGRTNGISRVLGKNTVFLEKPVRRAVLLRTVRKLLDGPREDTHLP